MRERKKKNIVEKIKRDKPKAKIITTFEDSSLQAGILLAIKELGFETPTPIQAQTIPHLMSSTRDLIASAQTGTGKTAAFGLPAIHLTEVDDKSPQTLILCPTRELCIQITNDLKNYSKYIRGINIVAVYGGASIEPQMKALHKGAHIVVGTPGRTKDLIRRKKLELGNVNCVVLDEADEMLTMGFKDDLDAILKRTPDTRQTLLFSATMSKKIIGITEEYMRKPVQIEAERTNSTPKNVEHLYYVVNAKDRYEVLKRIADINPNIYGISFCRTRRETKEIANKLMQDGYNADALHGDLSQAQRDEVMGRFRKRQLQILVATDVAARGLDVNDLSHVINYNLPDDEEIYIHRSGRTGRAGKNGISIAIVHSRELRKIHEIEKISSISFRKEQVPTGKDICQKQLYSLINKIHDVEVNEHQIEPFLPEIYEKLEGMDREQLIKHFVSAEFNRFLAYYKNAKDINITVKETANRKGKKERQSKEQRRNSEFTRFFINVGTNNGLNPSRLIGIINEGLKSNDAVIGKIEVLKDFSFFEVENGRETQLIDSVKGKKFEGVSLSIEISKEKSEQSSSKRKPSSSRNRDNRNSWGKKRPKRDNSGGNRSKRRSR
jgi:ATP-dependent RNA helicase DeaD